MVKTVNVHEAKTHLSRLLDQVSQGEEVIIAKAGRPVARLIAATERPKERKPGSARGTIFYSEDFDAPLPEEILDSFER
jgi:prevent-host-death family protein